MAHYAVIDENNTVTSVFVGKNEDDAPGNWESHYNAKRTSYNTRGGVYYTPNANTPDPDQSKAFRKNYAGIGYIWIPNGPDGEGFAPPKPYPSWVLNQFSYQWEAPVPMPEPNSPPWYAWSESTLSWVAMPEPNNPPYYRWDTLTETWVLLDPQPSAGA